MIVNRDLDQLHVGDLVRTAETGDEWLPVTQVYVTAVQVDGQYPAYDPSCARPGGVHITDRKPA